MSDLDKEVKILKARSNILHGRIRELESSLSWQLSQEIHTWIQVIFPEGTRRWEWYVMFIHGLKRFVNSFDRVVSRKTEINDLYDSYVSLKDISIRPLISIIIPVYNTPIRFLEKVIHSVRSQTYRKWELVIVDDGSKDVLTIKYLDRIQNDQILLIRNIKTKGIAGAQNVGIKHCRGQYIAFLDHDDELNEHALTEVVSVIQNKSPDIIYTDEEHIDKHSRKMGGYRKPGYSTDLLFAQNYFNHLTVIKTSLIKRIGGFRPGFEGSQDHDMLLRAIELTNEEKIVHIPKILYSWRQFRGSFSNRPKTKKIAIESGLKAINQALKRRGIDGYATENRGTHHYRIHRTIQGSPKVSIIIPFKNKYDLLRGCIDSIINKSSYKNIEIICVDNQSTDMRIGIYLNDLHIKYPFISHLKFDEKFNFSKINNWAVTKATGEHIIFLNNDTEVITADWIEQLLQQSIRKEVAFVGGLLLYPNNRIQHAGIAIGLGGIAGGMFPERNPLATYYRLGYLIRDVTAVTAACSMVKKVLFEKLGGFDETLAIAYNDVDICIRALKLGYKNIYTPFATLYHLESVSRGYEDSPQKIDRFEADIRNILKKHPEVFNSSDPHYRIDIWG